MAGIDVKEDSTNKLIEASTRLGGSLKIFEDINQKANFIALCASIEGAKMRGKIGTFSIVAQQIAEQAQKNNVLSEKLKSLVAKIESQALEAVAIRNLELAADLIDKLDRNLFERNCDVQAWATFDLVINAILYESGDARKAASQLLEKLVTIYVVYSESLLVDKSGNIVAAAKNSHLLGKSVSDLDWFRQAAGGSVYVTDAHFSDLIQGNSVNYCAPVMSEDNEVIGVLANFFNWEYALEMIHSGEYGSSVNSVIINSTAKVIASTRASQIMQDHYDWLNAGRLAAQRYMGHSLEKARNGESLAIGFCYTKGYNSYRGKGWSAVISENIPNQSIPIQGNVVDQRNLDGTSTQAVSEQIQSEKSGHTLINTMKEIDELVFEINVNNREVKLLAVNASIQAGLAGGEGEGFSIIANEVANLAKKSLNFVEMVNSATENLRKVVEDSISVRLVDAAKDTVSKVDRNLFERYCDIQAWSTFNKFKEILIQKKSGDSEAVALLQKIHKIYEVYHDLYVLNTTGDVVATAIDQTMLGKNFEQSEWFKSAINGHIFYSDIEYSDTLKVPVIKFSAPILSETHQVLGVIVSWFNCSFLNDIIKATIVDSKSETILVNHKNQVIAARIAEDIFKRPLTNESFIANFTAGAAGFLNRAPTKTEESQSVGYASSKGYNTYKGQSWVVITQRPSNASGNVVAITPEERFKQKLRLVG